MEFEIYKETHISPDGETHITIGGTHVLSRAFIAEMYPEREANREYLTVVAEDYEAALEDARLTWFPDAEFDE